MQSATGLHSVTAAVRVLSTGRVHSERACTGRRSWDTEHGSVAEGRGGGTARGSPRDTRACRSTPGDVQGQGQRWGRTSAPLASCGARLGDPPGLSAPPCPLH